MKYLNHDLKLRPSINVWIQEVPSLLNHQRECKKITKTKKVSTPVTTIPLIITPFDFKFLLLFIIWDFISIKQVKNKERKFSSTYLTVKLKKTSQDIDCKIDFAKVGHFLNNKIVLKAPKNPVTTNTPKLTAMH